MKYLHDVVSLHFYQELSFKINCSFVHQRRHLKNCLVSVLKKALKEAKKIRISWSVGDKNCLPSLMTFKNKEVLYLDIF